MPEIESVYKIVMDNMPGGVFWRKKSPTGREETHEEAIV
jgi:hypothetical protein